MTFGVPHLEETVEWPVRTDQRAQTMVDSGVHVINYNNARTAANELGYEEWYYEDGFLETMAFSIVWCHNNGEDDVADERRTTAEMVKVQFFPQKGIAFVCHFQDQSSSYGTELRYGVRGQDGNVHNMGWCREFCSSVLGIASPREDEFATLGVDALFCDTSKKSIFVTNEITTLDKWKQLLADPLHFGKDICYTRHSNIVEAWQAPASSHSLERPEETEANNAAKQCKCVDSARRWHHLAVVAGISEPDVLGKIQWICQSLDALVFMPGPPCLMRSHYLCGASCAVRKMLLEIGSENYNVIGFTGSEYAWKKKKGELDSLDGHYDDLTSHDQCANLAGFLQHENNAECLADLKEAIVALPESIRLLMLLFHFERLACGAESPTMIDADHNPLWSYDSFVMDRASTEFSRLLSGLHSEWHWCSRHGTFYPCRALLDDGDTTDATSEPSDDDEMSDSDSDEDEIESEQAEEAAY